MMKKFPKKSFSMFLLAILLPIVSFAQPPAPDTWAQLDFDFDGYASEVTWTLEKGSNVVASGGPYYNGLSDTTILIDSLVSGAYTLTVNDSYGDGLSWNYIGSVLLSNTCVDTLAYAEGNYGSQFIQSLTIAPCAPPYGGCLDPLSVNFDPNASWNVDSLCVYPPCAGLDTFWVETYCDGNNNKLHYHWSNMPNPNCRIAAYTKVSNINNLGNTWYPYPANFGNTGLVWNNQQPNTTYYFQAQLVDGTYTDTLTVTTGDCFGGCLDPTALNYNPWANSDDGSCIYPAANCPVGETNIIITVIPDEYPGETGWEIADTTGTVIATSPAYTQTNVPVVTQVCVPDSTMIEFTMLDSFGDGLCGSCYGGQDGSVYVEDLCGNTIFEINANQGNVEFGTDTTVTYFVEPCTPQIISGCMDPGYTEFNPQATVDDGSCATPVILGCIDTTAFNYDPNANTMSIVPSCDYTLTLTDGAEDGWFGAWVGLYQNGTAYGPYMMGPNDGAEEDFTITLSALHPVEVMFFAPGQSVTTANQCGFRLTGPDGQVIAEEGTNPWTNALLQFPFKYIEMPDCGNYCIPSVYGCMDSTALNYNPLANTSDTCIYPVYGCTNPLAFNYDPAANVDDNSCIPIIVGCMDSTAWNYNPNANTPDGSCLYFGCTDSTALNYDPQANVDNGTCVYPTYGCTDPTMFNYNPNANVDDGSCIPYIYGCTDPTMWNYDSLANTDNGSCIPYIYGCTDSTMFNYDPMANTDNGTCIPYIYGCTDPLSLNYDPLANTLDNSCCYIAGCTDPDALNYDPDACFDDGTCVTIVYGCTDVGAWNYDPTANVDDSTCLYDAGCIDGPGNPYWLNDPCYAWVIDVDEYCCTNSWDPSCQTMYDYCQLGWPVGLDDVDINGILVYPNPTDNSLNIETHLDFEFEVRDMTGKLLMSGNDNRLELGKYESGVYILTIIHEGNRYNKRIIKQ